MPHILSRNSTLAIAAIKHAKIYINFFLSFPILLDFSNLLQMLWPRLQSLNTFFYKNTGSERFTLFIYLMRYLQSIKRIVHGSKSNVLKMLFPDIEKITNCVLAMQCLDEEA